MLEKRTARIGLMTLATLGWLGLVAAGRIAYGPRTWVVDDDGPADFADIEQALGAAREGDRIDVRAGDYPAFVLDKRVTLIGQAGAVAGGAEVRSPSNIAAITLKSLTVTNASETVIFDEVTVKGEVNPNSSTPTVTFIENCADVRFIDCFLKGRKLAIDGSMALRVVDSHVELVSSTIQGAHGRDSACPTPGWGGDGGHGMRLEGSSRVIVMLSDIYGGWGGDDLSYCGYGKGGDGGHGVRVYASASVIAAGLASNTVDGGYGGFVFLGTGYCGYDGDPFYVGGRASGFGCCTYGATSVPTPPDPMLERIGIPFAPFSYPGGPGLPTAAGAAASSVTLRVYGHPGSFTRLFLSGLPQVMPGGVAVELMLVRNTTVDLGFMPASGYIDFELPIGPEWVEPLAPAYGRMFAQASLIYPGGEIRRTNSVPLVFR
jgi:hypothetical protein